MVLQHQYTLEFKEFAHHFTGIESLLLCFNESCASQSGLYLYLRCFVGLLCFDLLCFAMICYAFLCLALLLLLCFCCLLPASCCYIQKSLGPAKGPHPVRPGSLEGTQSLRRLAKFLASRTSGRDSHPVSKDITCYIFLKPLHLIQLQKYKRVEHFHEK